VVRQRQRNAVAGAVKVAAAVLPRQGGGVSVNGRQAGR